MDAIKLTHFLACMRVCQAAARVAVDSNWEQYYQPKFFQSNETTSLLVSGELQVIKTIKKDFHVLNPFDQI